MQFECLSVFPHIFDSYINESILARAQRSGMLTFQSYDLRDWTHDVHRSVDDAPFGGGQGMLMKPEPLFEAIDDISALSDIKPHIVFFSPVGKPWNEAAARRMAQRERVLLVCGRYEGIDERVYSQADEIISLGDYVLCGGELAALVVIDSTVRLIDGVLGNAQSAVDESFSDNLLEYAQYTRPASYRGMNVPDVLLSGNHAQISAWRRRSALERTARLRPDLLEKAELSADEQAFVEAVMRECDQEQAMDTEEES